MNMKLVASVVGIVGAIAGAMAITSLGGQSIASDQGDVGLTSGMGALAWICVVVAVAGSALTLTGKASLGRWATLAAALLGFVAITTSWIPAGLLLLVSGVLAFGIKPEAKRVGSGTGPSGTA